MKPDETKKPTAPATDAAADKRPQPNTRNADRLKEEEEELERTKKPDADDAGDLRITPRSDGSKPNEGGGTGIPGFGV